MEEGGWLPTPEAIGVWYESSQFVYQNVMKLHAWITHFEIELDCGFIREVRAGDLMRSGTV